LYDQKGEKEKNTGKRFDRSKKARIIEVVKEASP
jgi:hypothetical protein